MASNSQGIQQLLAAEKSAAEKVQDARKRKTKRLKQAKEEAQAEINAYKKERETQFEQFEKQMMGSKDDMTIRVDQETEKIIHVLSDRVNQNKQAAVDRLLEVVFNVQPSVHINTTA